MASRRSTDGAEKSVATARKAHQQLRRLGCRMLLPAENLAVTGTSGPLLEGEQQRAGRWAAQLLTERHRV